MSEHSAEHTAEPWRVDLNDMGSIAFSSYVGIEDAAGVCVAYVLTNDRATCKPIAEWKANARRIVAAVNACQGLSTEALEQSVVAKMREALEACRSRLKQDLDEVRHLREWLSASEFEERAEQDAAADDADEEAIKRADEALALSRSGPEDRGTV